MHRLLNLLLTLAMAGPVLADGVPIRPTPAPPSAAYPVLNPARPAPAGLTEKQIRIWNANTSHPAFKSIEIINLDPAILQSPSITLNVGGQTYVMEGKTQAIAPSPSPERMDNAAWSAATAGRAKPEKAHPHAARGR